MLRRGNPVYERGFYVRHETCCERSAAIYPALVRGSR